MGSKMVDVLPVEELIEEENRRIKLELERENRGYKGNIRELANFFSLGFGFSLFASQMARNFGKAGLPGYEIGINLALPVALSNLCYSNRKISPKDLAMTAGYVCGLTLGYIDKIIGLFN